MALTAIVANEGDIQNFIGLMNKPMSGAIQGIYTEPKSNAGMQMSKLTLAAGTGYPVENDVRDGVVYGASSELNGDLVLPAQGDVRSGTGYGADGTEFTGTMTGGSGGAVWLRAR